MNPENVPDELLGIYGRNYDGNTTAAAARRARKTHHAHIVDLGLTPLAEDPPPLPSAHADHEEEPRA